MAGFIQRRKLDLLLAIFSNLQYGSLTVTLPDGSTRVFDGARPGPSADVQFHSMDAVARLISDGKMGFCEAVMDGEIDSSSMSCLIELAVMHDEYLTKQMAANAWRRISLRLFHGLRRNSKSGSARNIAYHYDLGNDFYLEWLDDTLTYSSGFFKTGLETLSEAQKNKFESLIEGNEPRPGDHVLEIGSGWGSFAFYLISKFPDIKIDTLTISKEQYEFVKTKIREHHLENKLNVIYKDYREHQGEYSRIYSIEMFEAVGIQYWQTYFEKIKDLLKPSGVFSMQTIVIFEDFFERYTRKIDFIQKYIFPGGMLPSVKVLEKIANQKKFDFQIKNQMADSYYQTLEMWRKNFNNKWDIIKNLGYSEDFKRMWNFYLSYCSGGFKAKTIDVYQIDFINK